MMMNLRFLPSRPSRTNRIDHLYVSPSKESLVIRECTGYPQKIIWGRPRGTVDFGETILVARSGSSSRCPKDEKLHSGQQQCLGASCAQSISLELSKCRCIAQEWRAKANDCM